MGLERIYSISIERSERNSLFLKSLEFHGIDLSIDERHEGHDVRDYENRNDFFEDAKRAHPDWNVHLNYNKPAYTGLLWSIRDILKDIQKRGYISMMVWDDTHINCSLETFNKLLNELPASGFKCLQIYYCDPYSGHPDFIVKHARNQKKITPRIYENFRTAGDNCTILSPAGAKMMLEAMQEMPQKGLEGVVAQVRLPRNIRGCYSVVDPKLYLSLVHLPSDLDSINNLFSEADFVT